MKAVQAAAIKNLKIVGIPVTEREGGERTGFLLDLCKEVAEATKETINDYTDDGKFDWMEMLAKINDILDISRVVARHAELQQDLLALSKDDDYANDIEQAVKLVLEDKYNPAMTLRSPASTLNWIICTLKMVWDYKLDVAEMNK